MKAMLLAAGRGNRLRPWTDSTPKPLLPLTGKPLIVYHIEKLATAGFSEIIINISYLSNQIEQTLGNGKQYGVKIVYSQEDTALETGGGIYNALPLLGPNPFLVVNADIYTDFPLTKLPKLTDSLGHIVLVSNPQHNLQGDYHLTQQGKIVLHNTPKYTFSGIGIYSTDLFRACTPGVFRLPTVFEAAIATQQLSGQFYSGLWCDMGTAERWDALEKALKI
jgi:MurNAc alpha-1-phosphate uridylyltransferase